MNLARQIIALAIAIGLLSGMGCTKKPPQLPAQAKLPADTVPSSLPAQISEETPPPLPAPEPKQEPPAPEPPKPKPVQQHKKKKTTPPPATTQNSVPAPPSSSSPSSASGNTTVAAAHPPANPADSTPPDPAISANVSSAQLNQQKQTTAQLLDETEKALSGLNRTLSHDEEEVVSQIRSYIAQSRSATKDGDFERAYNLATKAHLLSDALAKK